MDVRCTFARGTRQKFSAEGVACYGSCREGIRVRVPACIVVCSDMRGEDDKTRA